MSLNAFLKTTLHTQLPFLSLSPRDYRTAARWSVCFHVLSLPLILTTPDRLGDELHVGRRNARCLHTAWRRGCFLHSTTPVRSAERGARAEADPNLSAMKPLALPSHPLSPSPRSTQPTNLTCRRCHKGWALRKRQKNCLATRQLPANRKKVFFF